MRYTVYCGGEAIGESELELPRGRRGERSGIFHPAGAFERVAPLFRRRQELVGELAKLAEGRPPGTQAADAMRRALAESGLGQALRSSRRELESLSLELRQPDGTPLPARELNIFLVELPEPRDAPEELRTAMGEELAAVGLDPAGPNYMLHVLPTAAEPDEPDGEARRVAG